MNRIFRRNGNLSSHNSLCSLENRKFRLLLIGTSHSQILPRLDKNLYIYIYKQELGDLFGFKKLEGKKYFEPCFQLLKMIDLEILKNPNKYIFVKKKEKHYEQSRVLLFADVENLGLVPISEAKSGKESTLNQ